MIMPRGGKLLSGEQSVRLAILDSVDRQIVIEYIAAGLHADEILKDRRMRAVRGWTKQKRKGFT